MFQINKSKINQLFFMSVSQKMSGKNEEHSVEMVAFQKKYLLYLAE